MSKTIKNLFIVDDDDVYVMLTKRTIKSTNQVEKTSVFENGLDAINFLKENAGNPDLLPEIILLDLTMPIMDGWQFLDEFILLKPKIAHSIKIYIVSSSISPYDRSKALRMAEVSEFIIKPISSEKLLEIF